MNKKKMVSESHDGLLRITKKRWRRCGRMGATWRNPNVLHRRATEAWVYLSRRGPRSSLGRRTPDPDQFKPGVGERGRCEMQAAQKGGWRPAPGTVLPNLNWKIWDQNHLQRDSVVEND